MKDRIILASASPRRSELLKQAGMQFTVIPSKGKETVTSTHPAEVVEELSSQKAWEVADRILRSEEEVTDFDVVIGADTVVAADHQILGKPADHEDAAGMIGMLQGRDAHDVARHARAFRILRPHLEEGGPVVVVAHADREPDSGIGQKLQIGI